MLLHCLWMAWLLTAPIEDAAPKAPTPDELIAKAIQELVQMQEPDGEWPYEGVYRVKGEIPVGYQIGGTSIVATTLLYAAPDNEAAKKAIEKAVVYVLKKLEHPLMEPSTQNVYDVRVWGHGFALDFFCHLRAAKAMGNKEKEIQTWIPKLVSILIQEEIPGGGWNYANHQKHASFVTTPLVQALLLARSQGEKIPDEIFQRARRVLELSRLDEGNFIYSGTSSDFKKAVDPKRNLPGAIARSPGCEVTLSLLGGGSAHAIQQSVQDFHLYWDELEKRRKKTGTHEGPYQVAPYYFYYGHRYVAQAIEMLPEKERATEREKWLKLVMKTRDEDGTWNDRVFQRSRNFGTSMIVLGLLREKAPTFPPLKKS